jgi:hypothetical protein
MRYSTGKLVVTPEEKKLHVAVDPGIVDLTRALIPPVYRQYLNRQKYPPHITVIRTEDWKVDTSLHGREVLFEYDPRVKAGEVYWWLRAWSPGLISLRQSLGLPDYAWACRPPDNEDCFHITVGNTK